MITHSQGELNIWLGSCAQNETKMPGSFSCIHTINIKQKIKHNKIQLEQELWSPAYMNNGKLPHKKSRN